MDKRYDSIKPYISVRPSFESSLKIDNLISNVDYLPGKVTNYHVTLISCSNSSSIFTLKKAIQTNITHMAMVEKCIIFESVDDKRESVHLVLKIKAPSLHKRHKYFLSKGVTHMYPQYAPHVTIAANPHKSLDITFFDAIEIFTHAQASVNKKLEYYEAQDSEKLELNFTGERLEYKR